MPLLAALGLSLASVAGTVLLISLGICIYGNFAPSKISQRLDNILSLVLVPTGVGLTVGVVVCTIML